MFDNFAYVCIGVKCVVGVRLAKCRDISWPLERDISCTTAKPNNIKISSTKNLNLKINFIIKSSRIKSIQSETTKQV